MSEREEDMHKVWLENLTKDEYEAFKAARRRREEEDAFGLRGRPQSF